MRGHKRFKDGSWRLIVDAGKHPMTGRRRQIFRTVRAPNTRVGAHAADVELARLVVEVTSGETAPSAQITVGELLVRWVEHRRRAWEARSPGQPDWTLSVIRKHFVPRRSAPMLSPGGAVPKLTITALLALLLAARGVSRWEHEPLPSRTPRLRRTAGRTPGRTPGDTRHAVRHGAAMSQLKRLAVAGAGMILVVIVTTVLAAPPASASATPCDGTGHRYYWTASGGLDTTTIIYFPAHDAWEQTFGGTGFWSCSMAQGASGSPVSRLQRDINQCYSGIIAAPLVEDGQFGTKTKAALVAVQRYQQIEANGQYGPQTARTMWHTYYSYWYGEGCLPLEFFGWPGNTG